MKAHAIYIRLTLAMFSYLFAFPVAYVNAEPSKKETIEWLKQKLNGLTTNCSYTAVVVDRREPFSRWHTITSFSVEGDMLHISQSHSNITIKEEMQRVDSMDARLSDLAPHCRIAPFTFTLGDAQVEPGCFELTLRSKTQKGITLKDSAGEHQTASYTITIRDEELVKRVAKAFEHLIKLSGGKEEPF